MKKIKQFLRQKYISLIFLLSTIALLSALILKNKEIDTIKEQMIVKNDKVNFLENKEVLQDEFNQLVEDYDKYYSLQILLNLENPSLSL